MKLLITGLLLIQINFSATAQLVSDLSFLESKSYKIKSPRKKLSVFKSQFPKEKYFENDYFEFSRRVFSQSSFPKSFFLSTDRLLRGGRMAYLLAPMRRRNEQGKIKDVVSYYHFR